MQWGEKKCLYDEAALSERDQFQYVQNFHKISLWYKLEHMNIY